MDTIKIKKAEDYLYDMYDHINCQFKFFNRGAATILTTSFGVQIGYLLNIIYNYPIEKICTNIKTQQNSITGLFIDKNYFIQDVQGFEEEYLLWQFTYYAIIALDMLHAKPLYPLKFLDQLKNIDNLRIWLEKQDIKNFWYTSNKIMFLFFFLIYEQERSNRDNHANINFIFDYLDRLQDHKTGFWGTQFGTPLDNAMYGASHIYLYYYFCGREIKYSEKIIDNTLKLQKSSGLFGPSLGGACEDYDGIEILTTVSRAYNFNSEVLDNSFHATYDAILKKQNFDGGFSYFLDNRNIFNKFREKLINRQYYYEYSGWNRMKSNGLKSDLWGTYFRVLTLAKIEKALDIESSNSFQFYSLPGWGY